MAQIDSSNVAEWLKASDIEVVTIQDGLYAKMHKKGSGTSAQRGNYVAVHYKGYLLNGHLFDQSQADEPFVFQLGYGQVISGWDEGLQNCRVGSKGDLYIAPQLGFGNAGMGDVPPNAPLRFEIEVASIMDDAAYDKYMQGFEQRERKRFEQQRSEQFQIDKKRINDYALDHKLKTKRTESGLSYAITKPGKGVMPQKGDTLRVRYEGFLLDDKPFDNNLQREVFSFPLGTKKVIEGWDEGLQFFNKGSEGWLLIPSKLAYGNTPLDDGKVDVPANSVLMFKIKVEDVVKH